MSDEGGAKASDTTRSLVGTLEMGLPETPPRPVKRIGKSQGPQMLAESFSNGWAWTELCCRRRSSFSVCVSLGSSNSSFCICSSSRSHLSLIAAPLHLCFLFLCSRRFGANFAVVKVSSPLTIPADEKAKISLFLLHTFRFFVLVRKAAVCVPNNAQMLPCGSTSVLKVTTWKSMPVVVFSA